jgi:hypothetical protein
MIAMNRSVRPVLWIASLTASHMWLVLPSLAKPPLIYRPQGGQRLEPIPPPFPTVLCNGYSGRGRPGYGVLGSLP